MRFRSTRGGDLRVSLDEALTRGIADDGGLFVPERLPSFPDQAFAGADIPGVAQTMLAPFFEGSALEAELDDIIAETFTFPIPTRVLDAARRLFVLELFHGPTAAFKDVGARFLAACLTRLEGSAASPLTILVATSGDTGGAVAAAFDGRAGIRVVVLYPAGRVSKRQEQQLTCWSANVLSLRVSGSFDDCQALVKAAFADLKLRSRYRFSSANSINIGRLLPQSIYYAAASLARARAGGSRPGFIVPTGNLGNALACVMAREMGLPVGPIVLATNANRTISDYFDTLEWRPRASRQTLATAMDVGDPGNMERLRHLLGDALLLREKLQVFAVSDEEIAGEIRRAFADYGVALCPHTATAVNAWRRLSPKQRGEKDWIAVATAHAAKFETVVESLIGKPVPPPAELAAVLERTGRCVAIAPRLGALAEAMDEHFGA